MNIGFDLDKIFIDYPPFLPAKLIDWLYKHDPKEIILEKEGLKTLLSEEKFNGKPLAYHIPKSSLGIFLRKLSHFYLFRPKIKSNIHFLHHFSQNSHHQLYLVSSRYSFLKDITFSILKRYHISPYFNKIFLNEKNEQPHLFKEKIIKKMQMQLYIDDDIYLLKYLQKRCPNTKFFWYNPANPKNPPQGIINIKKLSEIKKFLKAKYEQ